jgi:hypothetical protein
MLSAKWLRGFRGSLKPNHAARSRHFRVLRGLSK